MAADYPPADSDMEEFHDSLDMSESLSQPFDPNEPVTQAEDVPAQLAAEEARVAEKVARTIERRSKKNVDRPAVIQKDRNVVRKVRVRSS